eukprot:XP_024997892.1 uncharacterized protein LOC107050024 [Gallus gallus]
MQHETGRTGSLEAHPCQHGRSLGGDLETSSPTRLISAQFPSPGPQYSIPGQQVQPPSPGRYVGHSPTKARAPAYTFRGTKPPAAGSCGPGPCYFVEPAITRNGKYVAPGAQLRDDPRRRPPSLPDQVSTTCAALHPDKTSGRRVCPGPARALMELACAVAEEEDRRFTAFFLFSSAPGDYRTEAANRYADPGKGRPFSLSIPQGRAAAQHQQRAYCTACAAGRGAGAASFLARPTPLGRSGCGCSGSELLALAQCQSRGRNWQRGETSLLLPPAGWAGCPSLLLPSPPAPRAHALCCSSCRSWHLHAAQADGAQHSLHIGQPCYSVRGRSQRGRFDEDLAKTPGPAALPKVPVDAYKTRAPAYTMAARPKAGEGKAAKPGPADYSVGRVTLIKPQAPASTFGIRHSLYTTPLIVE